MSEERACKCDPEDWRLEDGVHHPDCPLGKPYKYGGSDLTWLVGAGFVEATDELP